MLHYITCHESCGQTAFLYRTNLELQDYIKMNYIKKTSVQRIVLQNEYSLPNIIIITTMA